jgi:CHAT domain-containing protein/tetratricopeptide (TPR) repeat protein
VAAALALAAQALWFGPGPALAQTDPNGKAPEQELTRLNGQIRQLQQQGKMIEALPLARRFSDALKARFGGDSPQHADALNSEGQLYFGLRRWPDAEQYMRQALAIYEALARKETKNPALASIYLSRALANLAEVYRETNRPSEAEAHARRALTLAEGATSSSDKDVAAGARSMIASCLNTLALLKQAANQLAEAEQLLRRVVEVHEQTLGAEHIALASSLGNLAWVLAGSNRLAEAEQLFNRVLNIRFKQQGILHPDYAGDLARHGNILLRLGHFKDAEASLRQALETLEPIMGREHAMLSGILGDHGKALRALNRRPDAETAVRRALAIDEKALGPEHWRVGVRLGDMANLLREGQRPAEAEPMFRRALALAERGLGPDHPTVAGIANDLALTLMALAQLTEAESLLRRALASAEKVFGVDNPALVSVLNNLALVLHSTSRLGEAVTLQRRVVAIYERQYGPQSPALVVPAANLARLLLDESKLEEAEALALRAIAIGEKTLPPTSPDVVPAVLVVANVQLAQARLRESEAMFLRAIGAYESALGPEHPTVADALLNYQQLLHFAGRLADSEQVLRRVLAIYEKSYGAEHPSIGNALQTLGSSMRLAHRYDEAEPLLRRALAQHEKALGPHHSLVARDLEALSLVLMALDRLPEAEDVGRRALMIDEKNYGPDHPAVATRLGELALYIKKQGRLDEAEPLYRRALTINEKLHGRDHISVALALNNLALLLQARGKLGEAQRLLERALSIDEKNLGASHPIVPADLQNLAFVAAQKGDWQAALAHLRRAHNVILKPGVGLEKASTASGVVSPTAARNAFRFHVLAAHRASPTERALLEESFTMAQYALQTGAAEALGQMAERFASSSGELAALLRAQQDLARERAETDRRLNAALGKGDATAVESLRASLASLETRRSGNVAKIQEQFPEYASLAAPEPISIVATQQLIGADEALVQFLDVPPLSGIDEQFFVWVLTRQEARWFALPHKPRDIAATVLALRCGLDATAWQGPGEAGCRRQLRASYGQADLDAGRPLPFDLAHAHALYESLFGQIKPFIAGKRLLIVPSGALSSLPFHVLVTEKPASPLPADARGYADAAWLARQHAVMVLPSVAGLKALRQSARPSQASEPFIGFGNPLLLGPDGNDRRAWERQACARALPAPAQIASRGLRSATPKFFRSGLADVAEVRAQHPLPETADELCAVARLTGAAEAAVHLGETATEAAIKSLSADGRLASARVVHFATHGLLAGETEMLAASKAEPALILTPPATPTALDDGLLTASEVAQLKLDADWVILSACNTAAAGAQGAEALSGLARAFFYAGARALLVSHWAVYSDATVKLITDALGTIAADKSIGRSESLRRSMLALIDKGQKHEAHPAFWAPFVVVGEGATH